MSTLPRALLRDTLTLAADGASGTLLLESEEKDGGWSTLACYRMRRLPAGHAGGAPE
jgi:hypothetical protein